MVVVSLLGSGASDTRSRDATRIEDPSERRVEDPDEQRFESTGAGASGARASGTSAILPRRDAEARHHLLDVARKVSPTSTAGERIIAVPGDLGELLPGGGIRRGTVVRVGGPPGHGATSVVMCLLAAATEAGERAVVVDPEGTFGGLAALEAGVTAERLALVRGFAREQWSKAVAALLEGFTIVASVVPVGLRFGDASRLAARAREQGSLLVAVESAGVTSRRVAPWPAEAALTIGTTGVSWEASRAVLGEPRVGVEIVGKGAAVGRRHSLMVRAG